MINLLLSLIVYFDSECKIPAVKMEDRDRVNLKYIRNVNVIKYYKIVNDKCVEVIEDKNLLWVMK